MTPAALLKRFKDASISRKLYFTVGIMALLIAIELAVLFFSIHTLSSVRAYVGGEGLWSKAQKDAVYQLIRYGRTHREEDYQKFLMHMQVPQGDHKALMALKSQHPDEAAALQGLIEGRNHEDDVKGMMHLFKRFHAVVYIHKAIDIWEEADREVNRFTAIGKALHEEMQQSEPSQEKINEILESVHPINSRITVLEDDFSYTLGEGSRWLENLVLRLLFVVALTVECTGLLLTISITRGIQKSLNELVQVAQAVTAGIFSRKAKVFSGDEIGFLAGKFNQMSDSLYNNIHKLEQEQKKFSLLLESAPDAMLIINKSGMIQSVNRQGEQVFGYAKEELAGVMLQKIIPQGLDRFLTDLRSESLLQGLEVQARKKSGEIFPAEVNISSLATDEGFIAFASVRNISERKYMKELEQKNTELEQFAYVASHDLRDPVNSILGILNVAELEHGENKQLQEYITFIRGAATRMINLISDLLTYSRLGQETRMEQVDCNEIIKAVLADMKARIEANQALVQHDQLPVITGNPLEIRLLFQNLIGNAIKFHKPDACPRVTITSQEHETHVQFTIKDNGIGMDPKNLNDIFTIFKRLHDQAHFEGTGIGLAHCKKIVQLHQGRIWAESVPGEGSTFHFTLSKTIGKA